ncbi:MAG: peptide ABC transporter substrate-binding protein, partial [Cyanobacteria bacterium P01_D01_bin.2]
MVFFWSRPLGQSPVIKKLANGLLPILLVGCQQTLPTADSLPSDGGEEVIDAPDVLTLIYSRSPVTLNPHLATGFQDFEAARIVYEPLASYGSNGELIPVLAAQIPSLENGDISDDGRSVTWRLQPT